MGILYDNVYKILEPHLGDATQRFLDRQIKYHLSKSGEDISFHDLEELARWCKLSALLVLDNKEAVEDLYQKIIDIKKIK
jgi:hypothetical protein